MSGFMRLKRLIAQTVKSKPLYGENAALYPLYRLADLVHGRLYRLASRMFRQYPAGTGQDVETLRSAVEEAVLEGVTRTDADGTPAARHLKTRLHSGTAHALLAQKTLSKALLCRHRDTGELAYRETLVDVLEYCLRHREPEGFYRMHWRPGAQQDEGPVTAGMIQVLCDVYELTRELRYLEEATLTAKASIAYLCDADRDFLHTRGRRDKVTNINSSYALAFASLYEKTGDGAWRAWATACIEHVLAAQSEAGLFFYSDKKRSIFRGLYHFMVVKALHEIRHRYGIAHRGIEEAIVGGVEYGKRLVRDDGSVAEHDMGIHSFLPSCTRALVTFTLAQCEDWAGSLERFLGRFFVGSRPYLLLVDGRIGDGAFRRRKDLSLVDIYLDLAEASLLRKRTVDSDSIAARRRAGPRAGSAGAEDR